MADLSTDVPDPATRADILRLVTEVESSDGAPPLSDQALTRLGSADVDHVLFRDGGAVAGYGQRDDDGAELVAWADTVAPVLDALTRPGLLVWSHGQRSRLLAALEAHGYARTRELHQLRRPLAELPPDPPLSEGVVVRAFVPGADDDAWLTVNAAAFATHPEQGRWTADDLQARIAEPWFSADGFLLAERGRELLGFHWTKVHPNGLGEVYVLGVAPAAQGLGLGNALLVRGLRHLADAGCPAVLLYVDGDNPAAMALYAKAGFTRFDLDVQWRAPAT